MSKEIEKTDEVKSEVVTKEVKEQVSPEQFLQDFDWVSYQAGVDTTNLEEIQKMYTETLGSVKEREIIDGTIIRITDREVIVDIGYKSEGIISLNEFRANPDLKVGDVVEVLIQKQEDKLGQMVLSHKRANVLRSWNRINKAFEDEEILQGHIKCRTNGGMIVEIFGLETFLPGSQIDVTPIKDYDKYVDKKMEFKVVKINRGFNNIVVSHKALIESDIAEQKREIVSQLEKGQLLEGVVKNITPYGAFVDLGGIDGLIHITDLSWSRVSHPSEVVELEQKINVVILDFDKERSRIQLGLKQLQPHPWDSLDKDLKEGDKIKGKVSVIVDYGAFIEIVKGVEGLVHVSEMSWVTHLRSAHDFLKVGDEVEAVILTLDQEKKKISLGIKQLTQDPWEVIAEKYPVGTTHTGTVNNLTNFGAFVELENGIEGLVFLSDLSWGKKIKHPSDFVKTGDKLDVKVMELDLEARKLNLSHKHTTENPWNAYEEVYKLDSVHSFAVKEVFDKGAILDIQEGIDGFVPNRHMLKEDGSTVKKGETVEFKVIEFNKDFQKMILSHTQTFKDLGTKKSVKVPAQKIEKTTMGDLDILSKLKSDIDNKGK